MLDALNTDTFYPSKQAQLLECPEGAISKNNALSETDYDSNTIVANASENLVERLTFQQKPTSGMLGDKSFLKTKHCSTFNSLPAQACPALPSSTSTSHKRHRQNPPRYESEDWDKENPHVLLCPRQSCDYCQCQEQLEPFSKYSVNRNVSMKETLLKPPLEKTQKHQLQHTDELPKALSNLGHRIDALKEFPRDLTVKTECNNQSPSQSATITSTAKSRCNKSIAYSVLNPNVSSGVVTSVNDMFKRSAMLGEGTYGVVYKAIKRDTGEMVALKKLRWESQSDGIPATSVREVALLRQLDHPNIVKLKGVHYEPRKSARHPPRMFLEFEYLELDLRKYMKMFPKRQIPLESVRCILYQILEGLRYCHARRIIHRDIKPNNILLRIQRSGKRPAELAALKLPLSQRPRRVSLSKAVCVESCSEVKGEGMASAIERNRGSPANLQKKSVALQDAKDNDINVVGKRNSGPSWRNTRLDTTKRSNDLSLFNYVSQGVKNFSAPDGNSKTTSSASSSTPFSENDSLHTNGSTTYRNSPCTRNAQIWNNSKAQDNDVNAALYIQKNKCCETNRQEAEAKTVAKNCQRESSLKSCDFQGPHRPCYCDTANFCHQALCFCSTMNAADNYSLLRLAGHEPPALFSNGNQNEIRCIRHSRAVENMLFSASACGNHTALEKKMATKLERPVVLQKRQKRMKKKTRDRTKTTTPLSVVDQERSEVAGIRIKIADFGLARLVPYPFRPMTHEVVTLWYRAPEILLGYDQYTTAIDMWSVGCVFMELLLGRAVFAGEVEIDTLFKIFQLLGTPSSAIWENVEALPHYMAVWPKWPRRLDRYDYFRPEIDDDAKDLIDRLLQYDYRERITAAEALRHPWFRKLRQAERRNSALKGRNTY